MSERSGTGSQKDSEDEASPEKEAPDKEFISDSDQPMRDTDRDFVAEESEQSTTDDEVLTTPDRIRSVAEGLL